MTIPEILRSIADAVVVVSFVVSFVVIVGVGVGVVVLVVVDAVVLHIQKQAAYEYEPVHPKAARWNRERDTEPKNIDYGPHPPIVPGGPCDSYMSGVARPPSEHDVPGWVCMVDVSRLDKKVVHDPLH